MLFQLHHTFLYLLSIQLVSDAIHENYMHHVHSSFSIYMFTLLLLVLYNQLCLFLLFLMLMAGNIPCKDSCIQLQLVFQCHTSITELK
jgi:hypothetical protein